jgi:hypothetical protein
MRIPALFLRKLPRRAAAGALAAMLTLCCLPFATRAEAAEASQSGAETAVAYDNPLIEPYVYTPLSREAYPQLQNVINVLLMGFDQDHKFYAEDGGESQFRRHDGRLPPYRHRRRRPDHPSPGYADLRAGHPGYVQAQRRRERGRGKTTESGREKAREAASILLGNVPIDYYSPSKWKRSWTWWTCWVAST